MIIKKVNALEKLCTGETPRDDLIFLFRLRLFPLLST